jgi:hypothetical protein
MISRSVGAVAVLTLFLLCCLSSSGAVGAAAPAWTTFGAGPARLGEAPAPASSSHVARRFVLPLAGRITAQVLAAGGVFVAATTNGDVVGLDRNGFVLWHDRLGQLANSCPQLDGYGVVSTGVIDPSSRTVYVMDGFGRLHALALGTGVERSGWPVRVFADFDRELDWGALTLAAGSVYVPTAAYCDQPGTPGGIYRVDLASKGVTRWLAVPLDRGGGGGPWGWGGLAYDPAANSLFAGSSGAFSGGSNTGSAFTETAGFGERLIEFSTGLQVQSSSHPAGLPDRMDLDFVGSPLLVPGTSCGPMIVAATKNDTVYGWRRDSVAAGWAWKVAVEPYAVADPFVSQLTWSTATSSVYAVTGTELVRIKIGASCSASVVWRKPLGTHTENGSPTVAGNVVWFANNGTQKLVGYNATTGARVFSAPLGGTTLEAPAIVDGRLLIGTFTGLVEGFTTVREVPPAATAATRHAPTSWADARHGWQGRPGGVYATDDAGKSWRRIYPQPALALVRMSPTAGVISTGSTPGACMCATRQLWTSDAGKSWHATKTLSGSFVGGRGRVYFWEGGTLRTLALPAQAGGGRLSARTVESVRNGAIVAAAATRSGAVALVSARVGGQGSDTAPRVIVAAGSTARVVTLPTQPGQPLAQGIAASGSRLTVTAFDFTEQPIRKLTWTSTDGGSTWSAG